jgi:thiamine-phosphate pyrophosphorylase
LPADSPVRKAMLDFKLYLVTNRRLCAPGGLERKIRQACRAGVRAVQLREKDLSGRDLYRQARLLRRVTRETGSRLFINDRLDIAIAGEADGVHCPERGLPPDLARKLFPGGADFLMFGPVFSTPSKLQYGPPQGLAALSDVTRQVSLPVLAVGGITPDKAFLCLRCGAAGVAVISAVLSAPDPVVVIREFDQALGGL